MDGIPNVTFLPTKRNGRTLVLDNFMFRIIRTLNLKSYWRCKTKNCKCTVILQDDKLHSSGGVHNHPPESEKVQACHFLQKIKDNVLKQSSLSVPKLYHEALAVFNSDPQFREEVSPHIPAYASIKSTLYREMSRRQPPLPASRAESLLQSELTEFYDEQPFLLDMRISYKSNIVVDPSEYKEPVGLFKKWFDRVCQNLDIKEPNAMVIATATKSGQPSCRNVLMKQFDKNGLVFFTGYNSRKGQEMEENPRASVLFYWQVLHQQVRIEGEIEKVSESESEAYFRTRPHESQLAALASNQSTRISDRQELLDKHANLQKKYSTNEQVPKPESWGGYRLKPDRVEFWQGHTNRLHHRVLFRRLEADEIPDSKLTYHGEDGWVYEYLSP